MIFLNILNEKFRKLGSGSEGFAMGLTLLVWPLMLIMVSGVFVTGESVLRKVQLQNAVDASAYAGAQVQADTLSRIAMINRMMAWTYIQANKMEMDYNVRNWANLTDRAMDAMKNPLANINQVLSFNCPDVAHKPERIAASGDVTMMLAACYSSFLAGESVTVPEVERFAGFPKLQSAASLLAAAVSGDGKAAEKLAKHAASAAAEREDICCRLEALAGIKTSDTEAELSLAEELQFAMMGNFGKSADRAAEKSSDPKRLLADFAGSGLIPSEKLIELQQRIDAAAAIINR